MKYPEVQQFCFCCSLETGCKIVAWSQMIFLPLTFLVNASLVVAVDYSPEDERGNYEPLHRTPLIIFYVEAVLALVLVLLGFLMAIVLLIGLKRKKTVLLDFWVKYETLVVILCFIFLIITSPFLWSYQMSSTEALINGVLETISIAFDVYLVIVVSSCRKEMSRRRIVPIPHDTEIQSTEIQYSRNEGRESPNNIVINTVPPKYDAANKGPDQMPLVEHEELQET